MKLNKFAGRMLALTVLIALVGSSLTSAAPVTIAADPAPIIVIDISHGQETDHGGSFDTLDAYLEANLTAMGYEVVWAKGGINASILENATGLLLPSIFGVTDGFLPAEISAIDTWFNAGHKFLWVSYDSDFVSSTSGQWINDNATAVLEAVGSHVYGEPTALYDVQQNVAGQSYRTISNVTSDDAFVADIVTGVTRVMMHSPTILYGSNSTSPGENVSAVELETNSLDNVYPFLYSSPAAQIQDGDSLDPYVHTDSSIGSFVTATIEVNAGTDGTGVIVVSGSKMLGGYHPMIDYFYDPEVMDGDELVRQAIDFGIETATYIPPVTTTTTTSTTTNTTTPILPGDNTFLYIGIGVGAVVVIVIIVMFMRKK
jgi:hypothetical protein